jgi:simple sugar transport system ATP-binding protein
LHAIDQPTGGTERGMTTPRLELRALTRRFGSFTANDAIDLVVQPGQIHALLGENGAGKSTLVKMVYGVLRPDSGEIRWENSTLPPLDPRAARRLGIGMVFQHFSLFEALSVAENIALGLDAPGPMPALAARIRAVSHSYGLTLDPARPVDTLGVGERQRIEIVRCLLASPRLLVMDEPTSVLTPQEVEVLFATLRRLAAEGCSILYISHKLAEIRALCEAATILRAGRVVASCDPRRESEAGLARLMMGADLARPARPARPAEAAARARPVLTVDGIDLPARVMGEVALKRLSVEIRAGEIVGVAGIAGNGQAELFAALSGERLAPAASDVLIGEASCGRLGPAARRALGLCALPEERNGHAAIPAFSLSDNAMLTAHRRAALLRGVLMRPKAARAFAERVIGGYDVRCGGPEAAAATLSGGNLQKFVLGREILQAPGVLVVAQPTWGVDAGAAALIHSALRRLAAGGAGVLVISQDLDELLALADRIGVLHEGTLSRLQPAAELSVEAVGLLMGGVGIAAGASHAA